MEQRSTTYGQLNTTSTPMWPVVTPPSVGTFVCATSSEQVAYDMFPLTEPNLATGMTSGHHSTSASRQFGTQYRAMIPYHGDGHVATLTDMLAALRGHGMSVENLVQGHTADTCFGQLQRLHLAGAAADMQGAGTTQLANNTADGLLTMQEKPRHHTCVHSMFQLELQDTAAHNRVSDSRLVHSGMREWSDADVIIREIRSPTPSTGGGVPYQRQAQLECDAAMAGSATAATRQSERQEDVVGDDDGDNNDLGAWFQDLVLGPSPGQLQKATHNMRHDHCQGRIQASVASPPAVKSRHSLGSASMTQGRAVVPGRGLQQPVSRDAYHDSSSIQPMILKGDEEREIEGGTCVDGTSAEGINDVSQPTNVHCEHMHISVAEALHLLPVMSQVEGLSGVNLMLRPHNRSTFRLRLLGTQQDVQNALNILDHFLPYEEP